jgi:streptomycin 6-kinase
VDARAIWEWGTIHRVIGGLYSRRIGFQPFGDLLLAEADRLTHLGVQQAAPRDVQG